MQTIKMGDQGSDVAALQETLNLVLGSGLDVDGDFGPKTNQAVIHFQELYDLEPNGVVDALTWVKLAVHMPPTPIKPIGKPRPSNAANVVMPPKDGAIFGIDISRYQPMVVWKKVKADGVKFCFLKATEGLTSKDPSFASHYAGARSVGIPVGAYHYFKPSASPEAQAAHFLKTANLKPGDLLPVLDLESRIKKPTQERVNDALTFLKVVADKIGRLPILYTGPAFLNELNNPQEFYNYPLWLANYRRKGPKVPPPWNTWNFWQYSDEGQISGINADAVDYDLFNGSEEDLKKFIL